MVCIFKDKLGENNPTDPDQVAPPAEDGHTYKFNKSLGTKKWVTKEKATKGWGNIWAYLHSQLNAKKFRGGKKKV